MASSDFDEVFGQARHILSIVTATYKDVTGEDLDLEGGIRHYPLLALGFAAGAGALAGYWYGRKSHPQLPPPPPEPPIDATIQRLGDAIPDALNRVRDALPEITVPDEVKNRAKTWMESQFNQSIDKVAENVDGKLSSWFGRAMQRTEPDEDTTLRDPEPEPEIPPGA
ncbi:MAG: hypothetical protein ACRDFX_12000 [Chloroflexota bacterium]